MIIAEASSLAAVAPSGDDIDEADLGGLKGVSSTATGTLSAAFTIPTSFSASDPNAHCPATQAQINAGLTGCAVAVAELSGTDFGDALLQYTGQPTAQVPTLSLGSASAAAGDAVNVSDGAGPGDWWGDAFAATTLAPSDITVHGVDSGATTATISAATYPITTKKNKTTYGPLTPPRLSGQFVVPCGRDRRSDRHCHRAEHVSDRGGPSRHLHR
jgi:hypothetical protein